MTLSYCWGPRGERDNPLLLVKNIKHRHEVGLRVSKLPKTFQHAVEVCKWFGVRWLWIDCLCIVQDSLNGDDWLREADLFGKTYRNALLNISADVGPNPRAGCFSERAALDVYRPQGHIGEAGEAYTFAIESENRLTYFDKHNASASRAWVHRERQLSPRVLHFTRGGMIWECCENLHEGSFASESLPDGVGFQLELSSRPLSLMKDQSRSREEVYADWQNLCRDMSGKSLTKRSDIALIMSDLAEDFSRIHHMGSYLAGHWKSTLPFDLLWHLWGSSGRQSRQPGPSWSWLSCGRQIMMPQSPYEGTTVLADLLGQEMKTRTRNPFGQFEGGELVIKGVVRPLCIQRSQPDGHNIQILGDAQNEHCAVESGSAEGLGQNSFTLNSEDITVDFPETFFLPRHCFGLIIQKP